MIPVKKESCFFIFFVRDKIEATCYVKTAGKLVKNSVSNQKMHKLQEICQRPKFIAEGASRFDVEQGEQGDPWLLAAVSSLTLTPKFLDRVVPPDQNFEHGYCGVFR